jgi:hypothetical protein
MSNGMVIKGRIPEDIIACCSLAIFVYERTQNYL